MAILTPYSALDLFATAIQDHFFLFPWIDKVAPHLDFCGLNYYGQVGASAQAKVRVPCMHSRVTSIRDT